MPAMTTECVEFRRIMSNLQLEEMDIPLKKQERLLEAVNNDEMICPGLIRELHQHG
ncbi:hypothetical protein [Alkalicoccus chagannorensis]|uniref:hypothetical protein n=1 Tax=Alkalicoccus chagannorensis TaxID=427072 RepID=UPI000403C190|nr:hypothetical protein [Alkalicoccus chagannorensis]